MSERYVKSELRRIAAQLQAGRMKAGYSQESLAEKLDISVGTIKTIETGTRVPSLPMLIRIASALRIEIILKGK